MESRELYGDVIALGAERQGSEMRLVRIVILIRQLCSYIIFFICIINTNDINFFSLTSFSLLSLSLLPSLSLLTLFLSPLSCPRHRTQRLQREEFEVSLQATLTERDTYHKQTLKVRAVTCQCS